MKANSIAKFDNSLTDFLMNALADKHTDAKSYAYKYNNLKVFMDPRKVDEPHFFVQIGISEACFSIKDGSKLEGGLGNEDGYVKRWADRYNIHKELEAHWKLIKEAIKDDNETDPSKKSTTSAMDKLRRAEKSDEKIEVDMTSTGIDRQKRNFAADKRKRFAGMKKELKKNKML